MSRINAFSRVLNQTLSWIFLIVLAHWNNSPRVDISLQSDTLFWFRANAVMLRLSINWKSIKNVFLWISSHLVSSLFCLNFWYASYERMMVQFCNLWPLMLKYTQANIYVWKTHKKHTKNNLIDVLEKATSSFTEASKKITVLRVLSKSNWCLSRWLEQ
jgi:hypothetical protein